jgi:hypothetical protein
MSDEKPTCRIGRKPDKPTFGNEWYCLACGVLRVGSESENSDCPGVAMSDEKPSPGPIARAKSDWRHAKEQHQRDVESRAEARGPIADASASVSVRFVDGKFHVNIRGDSVPWDVARDAPAMLELLRELEVDCEGSCPNCGKLFPRTDGHVNESPFTPCRLGALLDKHGRD